jgi:hypothetical protein
MARPTGVADFIRAAEEHGNDSDPDHEVGDLQMLANFLWQYMPEEARKAFLNSEEAKDLWETQCQTWEEE